MRCLLAACVSAVVLLAFPANPAVVGLAAPTEVEEGLPKPPALDELLRRVAKAAAGDAWREPDWRDPVIERWLDDVVTQINLASENRVCAIPTRFADVEAGDAHLPAQRHVQPGVVIPVRIPGADKILVVGNDVRLTHARKSIILADGNVRLSSANDCVIIARGAVEVAHGRRNVIVAGQFVHVSHDGHSQPARNPGGRGLARAPGGGLQMVVAEPGSLILSGGTIDVSHAAGGVYLASDALSISHATECSLINPPLDASISHRHNCRDVAVDLRMERTVHPLEAQMQLDWVMPGRGAVFRFRGKRLVAEQDEPIADESAALVEALAGWTLSFAHEGYAMFSNGTEDVGVKATPRR